LKIRFLIPARRELKDAVLYYNAQRPHLGNEFRDEVWDTIQRINKFPEAWHPLSASIRRCQMNRFPYGLIYVASENEILIIAVAHLHRAPEYWRSRADEI
jgi:toxin ParE2